MYYSRNIEAGEISIFKFKSSFFSNKYGEAEQFYKDQDHSKIHMKKLKFDLNLNNNPSLWKCFNKRIILEV